MDDVSFHIDTGEFIGLIGPNGAGKTTLLKTILGLQSLSSGTIAKASAPVGYVPQRGFMQNGQVPMSVLEIVRLGSKGDSTLALSVLEEVGMLSAASKRMSELSGGQQQRVLIAKALASHPSLLILDEPTTGIDQQSQEEFYDILRHLRNQNITVVMVSHDVDTVLKLVTRIICLNQTILYDGPVEHFDADSYALKLYVKRRRVHHLHGDAHA